MILSKEENIIKEWCYATSSKGIKETKHTLTITNKRVIAQSISSKKIIREELPINLIKGISSSSTKKPSLVVPLLFFIIGGLFAFMSLSQLMSTFEIFFKIISFSIYALLSALFIIIGINKLKQSAFFLTFHTNERNDGAYLSIGSTNITPNALPIFKLFLNKKVSIKVNNEVAEDILNSIGSIIIDCQEDAIDFNINSNSNSYNDVII